MSRPETHDLAWLKQLAAGSVVRAGASVAKRITAELPFPSVDSFDAIPADAEWLIAAGGGALLDEAKHYRARQRPALKLAAIPSLWGSGAEVSPIAVLNRGGAKEIVMGDEFLPDVVVYWPDLLSTVPPDRARHACGDAWSHALEAFLSPLACDRLREQLAALMRQMAALPLTVDERWFAAGARACVLQSRASVGLVHGIAHTLEHPLRAQFPHDAWGHAKLCSLFLLPVMNLNRDGSPKWGELATQYSLDEAALWTILEQLFEPAAYAAALPLLHENWMRIMRDPCTRTNGVLVRPKHLEQLEKQRSA